MDFLPFFTWLNNLAVSKAINNSAWLYAIIQAFHLVTLAVFGGALLIGDLRLLGRGFKEQPLRQVARDANPWLVWGFIGLVATGIPQLLSGAEKEYYSDIFWLKMEILVVATIFMFTVRHIFLFSEEGRFGSLWPKIVGVVSIALWIAVAIPARLIGLF
jgi:hypothetical protein